MEHGHVTPVMSQSRHGMDDGYINDGHTPSSSSSPCALQSAGACLLMSVAYVASLYVWNTEHNRDHPSTIKRRFFSVFVMMFVSPSFLYFCTPERILAKVTIWELLGLRWQGLFFASTLPLILTMVLFLGPLSMHFYSGVWKLYIEPTNWWNSMQNLIWLRNHVVAPLSEEFTFRACMLPLLLQCFSPSTSIFICPLFFGVAHFHHMVEKMKIGIDFKTALLHSCFQFIYTTIFGMYSAFLFVQTGHFASVFLAHAFCNHMGFPDIGELRTYSPKPRCIMSALFFVGLFAWAVLLFPLTAPSLYSNRLFANNSLVL